MGKLLNLAVYNPAILSDDDFLEGFVARGDLTERLLNRLREITPKNVARHLLLIGQRGMGKTGMLRRLALGVAEDTKLSEILLPLTFREEQYNVHNLHVFWCNCLDALGDYLEKGGRHDLAVQLDLDVARLESKGGDPDGNAACALFKEWCAKEGKRPLLFLDNIDLVLGGLKEQQQWGLRRILQERSGVVIVGASSGFLEAVTRVDAPFYEFFQVHLLERLSRTELLSCLRRIAVKRGDAGKKVINVLDSDPARIHTLYDLTGGDPRTLVLLYLLLEMNAEGDVMDDLERLLDQATPRYKARVEDLAPQTRVVLDAVALAWNPVTVAQVSADTGLESTSISSQFDRLQKMGILEKVTLSTPAPVGYQLSERFFNIWYLMRNASRRLRNRLRWLTEFLRRIYTSRIFCGPDILQQDHTGDSETVKIEPDGNLPSPESNLSCHLFSQPGSVEESETAYNEAIALLPEHAGLLLSACRALARDNFGEAKDSLARVMEGNHPELYTLYYDDLLRILRSAKERGYGDRLQAFLEERGLADRHWPLYAAFDAYLHGETRLRDVNPEVRGAAKRIYDRLSAQHSGLETEEEATAPGKQKGRKSIRKK
jgi:hypothetical protein